MKKEATLRLIVFIALIFAGGKVFSQQCAFINNDWGPVTPGCNAFGPALNLPSTSYGTFSSITGVNYTISTCGTSWDSQITGFDGSNSFISSGKTSGGTPAGTGFENDDNGSACSGLQASLDWTATFSGTVKSLVEVYSCGSTWSTSSAVLTVRQNTTITNTTSLVQMCGDGSSKALTASYGGTYSGSPTITWSIVSGPGSIGGSTYFATGVIGSSQTVTIRATLGVCTSDVSFTVYGVPTTANAGVDQTQCSNSSFTLAGNAATVGTGAWSLAGGSASITTPSSPTSGVTGVAAAANAILRWTISNGSCTASTDDVTLFNNLGATASAGGPDLVCQSSTPGLITLSGATIGGSASTGAWSILSGGGTLSSTAPSATPATRTYRPAANFSGTAVLQLITDDPDGAGPCTAVTSTRNVVVNPEATVSAGGPDVICQSATPSALTLTGSSIGGAASTGTWSIVSGGGSLSNTSPTASPAVVTYTPAANFSGTITLQLTTNDPDGAGPCALVSSNRTITVNPQATVNAGGPDVVCQSATPSALTLTGASIGGAASTGAWSILSGGGSLSNTSPTASPAIVTYTPAANFSGTVTLQLQTNDPDGAGPCIAEISTRTITVGPQPTVDAGGPDETCQSSSPTPLTLAGAVLGGSATTGTWSIISGGGTLSNTSPTSNPSGETYTPPANFNGTVTLQLTTDAPPSCVAATDTRTIIVHDLPAVAPSNNSPVCVGDQINLNANASGGAPAYTYSWTGPASFISASPSPSLANATAAMAGSYDVIVTDQNSCSVSGTTSVTVSPLPSGNISGSVTVCTGTTDTVLTFNFSVGTAPFDVSYTDGSNTFSKNGVNDGDTIQVAISGTVTYTFTQIQDANGCVRGSGFLGGATITVAPLPVITTATVTDALCNGGSSGTITITASTGTPPYFYSIDNGTTYQGSNLFTGLSAGPYDLAVADALNCSSTYILNPVNVGEPTVLDHTYVTEDASCSSVFDGKITVTATGGTSPYSYSVNGGPSQSGNVLSGLSGGAYTLQVEDFNGCTDTSHVLINNTYAVNGSIVSQTDVSCFGGVDGTVTLQLTGGVPPYAYSINGLIFQASPIFTGLASGNYVATLRDSKGCTDFVNVTIAQPPLLQVLLDSVETILCSGNNTGGIFITVIGGNGGYSFLWSNGDTTEDITGLSAGTYNVAVTDSKGCSASTGATISQPLPLFLSVASYRDLLCFNDSSGEIDITVNGGVPPYVFAWSNGAVTEDIINIPAATYFVTVTDANGCIDSLSQAIGEPTQLSTLITTTGISCSGGASGSVDLTVSGGTLSYTYLWSNGTTTEDLANVGGGNYSVVIHDANGCSISDIASVASPGPLVLSTAVTNVLCHDSLTGAIDLTVTGGTGAYTFSWSNSAVSEDISNLGAGNYSVVVSDANACTGSASATITQPAGLILNATTTAVCAGSSNGSIDITVQGGIFPYTYLWSNTEITEDVNGLTGGTYSVTVTDANGCTITQSFTISSTTAVSSSIVGTDVTCNGAANGFADLTVSGGVTPYSFLWSTFQNTEDIGNLSGGTYYVIITDASGCQSRDSVTISEAPALVLSASITNVLCHDSLTGAIDLTVSGGAGGYTFVWSNTAITEDLANLAAGNYSVTVTDANACTASISATVTQPSGLVLNATTTVGCAGSSNGSIDITVQGGVFPYSYLWSNTAVTEDVNGLTGGTYSVIVTDANGCTITQSFTISSSTPISSTIVGTDVTCNGAANGSADLTVSGGLAPYTFLWSTFQNTEDIANLSGGTYYVIITGANACQSRDSVIISEAPAMTLSTLVTNALCHDSLSGAIDLTVSGGAGNYTFVWSNTAITEDISGIVAGNYVVTVTDASACSASTSATVAQPSAIALSGSVTDVQCAGNNDGSIFLAINGGTPFYSFLWSNTATTQNILNLSSGSYSVTATDANGCSASASFTVNAPLTGITSTVTGTNVLCYGANTGTATVTASGGSQPYSYLWSNFQATPTITGLDGGIYYVMITDANGCTHRDSIIIDEPSQLILSIAATNISCFNANDGSIDLTVTGATPAYTYLWTNTAITEDINGLAGGNYTVTVTDDNGCTASASATIVNPSAITSNYVIHNPLCNGDLNGSIDLIPTGGTPNYSFNWSTTATTEDISGIGAGTYLFTITDSRGCTKGDSVVVTQPSTFYVSGVIKHVTCFGYNDGQIDATAYGGTLPYSFSWSTGQSTEDLWNLPGGSDTVYAFDANGCAAVSIYVINEPAPLSVSVTSTNVSCYGGTNATLAAIPAGGVTPYNYLWDDFNTDSARNAVAAGRYVMMLSDSNHCTAFDTAIITQPAPIAITGKVTDAACSGSNTGAIDITVTGGTPGFTYAWTGGLTTGDLANIVAGVYAVTVTDTNACVRIDSFEVKETRLLSTSVSLGNPVCKDGSTGFIIVDVTGGVSPYSYTWNTAIPHSGPSVTGLEAGTYNVTVVDGNNCSATVSADLTDPAPITVNTNTSGSNCLSGSALVTTTVTGGLAPYTYLLNGVANETGQFTNLPSGDYLLLVMDVNGCQGKASFNVNGASSINLNLGATQQTILTGMETQLVATVDSNVTILHYNWVPDSLFTQSSCTDCADPFVAPRTTTMFTVTVMISDSCYVSDTLTIYVNNEASKFIPTAFTPNGDGLNDRFEFDILGASKIDVSVFDRWGHRVYHNSDQTNGINSGNGWDGRVDGQLVPYDTYVYQIKTTYWDGVTKDVAGTVTLMK